MMYKFNRKNVNIISIVQLMYFYGAVTLFFDKHYIIGGFMSIDLLATFIHNWHILKKIEKQKDETL